MRPKLLLRADGNSVTGLGHIFRMRALAQICDPFFDCIFLLKHSDSIIGETIRNDRYLVHHLAHDLDDPVSVEQLWALDKNDIIVLDGYHFDTSYQSAVRQHYPCKLACVDDIHAYAFAADLIINHAGGVPPSSYSIPANARLLLGPAYAILRQPFYNNVKRFNAPGTINEIMVCMGGADPGNNTEKLVGDILNLHPALSLHVIIGSAYQHIEALEKRISGKRNVTLYKNLDVHSLLNVMMKCDTAICSASTIAYEYCSVTGLLFVIKTADNQEGLYHFLLDNGIAVPFDQFSQVINKGDAAVLRSAQMESQARHFDNHAGQRLLKEFKKLHLRDNIFIRQASLEDIDLYFGWANEAEVRKQSFNSAGISYEEHCKWFNAMMASANAVLYVATTGKNIPAGNIRFRISDGKAELSYLVDPGYRNAGVGEVILRTGADRLFEERKDISVIEGLVKHTNIASLKAFGAAGYTAVHSETEGVIRFQLKRNL